MKRFTIYRHLDGGCRRERSKYAWTFADSKLSHCVQQAKEEAEMTIGQEQIYMAEYGVMVAQGQVAPVSELGTRMAWLAGRASPMSRIGPFGLSDSTISRSAGRDFLQADL